VGPATDTSPEIVWVTAIVDSTHVTVLRGMEGSTIKTHSSGDAFTHTLTAGALTAMAYAPALSDSATVYVATDGNDSNNGLTWATAKATITAAVATLGTGGGTVQIGQGTFTVTSSSRSDAGVSYTGSGSTYSWTDTHITTGDVGSCVIGPGINGRSPKIVSVVAGTSFVTDIAPAGTVSAATMVIVAPAIVIGDGVTLQGQGAPFGAVPGITGGTIIYDNGTGITVFLRGGNNEAAYFGRTKIKDLGLWGKSTNGSFATTAGTLGGLYVNNNSSFLEVWDVDFTGHYYWGAAADYNINSIDFHNCAFSYCGHSGATTATGGFVYGLYNGFASAAINFYNCWGYELYGFFVVNAPAGQGSINLYSCQWNVILATSYYLSGSAVQVVGPNSLISNCWSESCALYDVVVNYGYCTVISSSLFGAGTAAVYIAGSSSVINLIGVDSASHSSATVVRSAGVVNWVGGAISDTTFMTGGPTPTQASGIGNYGGGPIVATGGVSPGNFGAMAPGNQIWQGSGAPASGNGSNGDYYFRTDGTGTSHIYFKSSGAWAALV
jgi:hypothetical protein